MRYYKVLIVDDEEVVCQGITQCVAWNELGFEIIGNAGNGEDALELAEEYKPDLVITDIKMPYMDGLELTRRLGKSLPFTKIVIITGFDDFHYAKQAISLNVLEYIIKPINLDEFSKILQDVKKIMDEEHARLRDITFLKEHYNKSLPILKESFLLSILEGRAFDVQIESQSNIYGMAFHKSFFVVACMLFNQESADSQLLQFSIKRMAEEILSKYTTSYLTVYMNYVVAVSCLDAKSEIHQLIVAFDELSILAEKYFGVAITIGIGYMVDKPSSLHRSYRGAIAALDYRMIIDDKNVILIDDIEPDTNIQLSLDERFELSLLSAIRQSDQEQIKDIIHMLLDRCSDIRLPYRKYQTYILEILNSIISFANSFHINNDIIFGEAFYPIEKLSSFKSKKDTIDWFVEVCQKVALQVKKERQNTSGRLVDKAKEYALQHYSDVNMSIEGMCNELHISPAYFSSLFKKETGHTFINYLSDLRLQEAKRLLIETDLKTYLIAEKIGFVDANYFSFVFKKRFGISPTKFRGGHLES